MHLATSGREVLIIQACRMGFRFSRCAALPVEGDVVFFKGTDVAERIADGDGDGETTKQKDDEDRVRRRNGIGKGRARARFCAFWVGLGLGLGEGEGFFAVSSRVNFQAKILTIAVAAWS
jgi:hypothetical protein